MDTLSVLARRRIETLIRSRRYKAAAEHVGRRTAGVNPRLLGDFVSVCSDRVATAFPVERWPFVAEQTVRDFQTAAARWWYLGERSEYAHVWLIERKPHPVAAVLPDGSGIDYATDEPVADWREAVQFDIPDPDEPAIVRATNPEAFAWLVETLAEIGWAVEVERIEAQP